jgi:sugar phosphate isomerase/epimerase
MSLMYRRDINKLLGGTVFLFAGNKSTKNMTYLNSVFGGVQIGAQSWSFRDRRLDACIEAYQTIGIGECELSQVHLEPQHVSREALRRWRTTTSMSFFHGVRGKFDRARVLIYAYAYNFQEDFTDAEIRAGFEMTRAMGLKYITTSSPLSIVHKLDGYAQHYRILVGFHNHDETWDPDQFSNAASFERGLKGTSGWVGVNLDIGHFVAANSDPVLFLRKWHSRIVTLHLKDRKRNHGRDLPWGKGDTPIIAVLRLVQKRGWHFPGNIEYEYGPGRDAITQVRRCFESCKKILTTDCQGQTCYDVASNRVSLWVHP